MTIYEIEALTQTVLEELKQKGKAELLKIKDYDCYLTDLGEYFGYSVLVFKNNHHVYYANDYQLHHPSMETKEELKQWYVDCLNRKLFTEQELIKEVPDYDEYQAKNYYIRNLWIQQFDYVSIFGIGEPTPEQKKAMKTWLYCYPCFCYVKDKEIVKKANDFINHIDTSFAKVKGNEEVFRKMIARELANHEACITGDWEDALDALCMDYKELSARQRKIVREELRKQMKEYYSK